MFGQSPGIRRAWHHEEKQMSAEKTDALLIGPPKPVIVDGLAGVFNLHRFSEVHNRARCIK
jgi:hypothetical protein